MRRLLSLIAALGLALLAFATTTPQLRLIYNASDSAPRGWYLVSVAAVVHDSDLVIAALPPAAAALADRRRYLPRTVPVLKHVAALAGDRVCIIQRTVHINGRALARVLTRDGIGRPLPVWRHCRVLTADELFLFNPAPPGAFDSRYFGPIRRSQLRGIAHPLWTWRTP